MNQAIFILDLMILAAGFFLLVGVLRCPSTAMSATSRWSLLLLASLMIFISAGNCLHWGGFTEKIEVYSEHLAPFLPFVWLSIIYANIEANRERERRAQDEGVRLLVENTEDIILMMDLEGRYLYYNGPARYGFTIEDVIGRTVYQIHDRDTADHIIRRIREVLETGQPVTAETTMEIGGETLRFLDQNSPIRDEQGNIRAIAVICRNITEIKDVQKELERSLEEKNILIKEIHHRVKNNLQVISGLLNLQTRYIDDPGVRTIYKESQNRIKTMALIHEELYRGDDLARVNLASYIRDLVENLFSSYTIGKDNFNLILDVPDAEMNLDTAIPCGLIVNELTSNALKHAFPDGRTGTLEVSMVKDGEEFVLNVADDGVGLPKGVDHRKTRTLGLQLVTILAEQLGGTLEHSGDRGTSFTLRFKEYREAGSEVH